jgi:hypothetical protein
MPFLAAAVPGTLALLAGFDAEADCAVAHFPSDACTRASAKDGGHGRDASMTHAPNRNAIPTAFAHLAPRDFGFAMSLILLSSHNIRSILFICAPHLQQRPPFAERLRVPA